MINLLYDFFGKLGYFHPIHPPFTHGPVGAVIVAFCFGLGAMFWRQKNLSQSAYYALAIAFVLLFPTVLAGILDWRHLYAGAWLAQIKIKIALTVLLLIFLTITLLVGRIPNVRPALMLFLITLCLLNVIGLGYFGGQLVYAGRIPVADESFFPGRDIFVSHCSGCHANGGNVFYPNLPLLAAPQLKSYEHFVEFLRNPRLPDGSEGPMPVFTEQDLSDQQVLSVYDYIINGISMPRKNAKP